MTLLKTTRIMSCARDSFCRTLLQRHRSVCVSSRSGNQRGTSTFPMTRFQTACCSQMTTNMKYISATSCRLHLRFCSALIFDPKISSLKRNSCSRELALCACRQSRWHELSMQFLLLCTLLIHSSTLLYYPFSTISNTSSTKVPLWQIPHMGNF